ncbi:MAG: hypothetical protein PARBB_03212 [Parabacteroides distasonis]
MRIINPIGGIILLFVLLGTLGCSNDSFQDEAKPVICPSAIYPKGAKLARVWYSADITSPRSLAKEYVYDESGRILKVLHPFGTDTDGEEGYLISYVEYVYDERGFLSEEVYFNRNLDQTYHNLSTLHYKYDEQGQKIKEITEYPVIGRGEETVFSYKDGLLMRKVEYDGQGRKLDYTDYEYDETGLLTKETVCDPETSEVIRYSEYRNENGLNMEIMVYTGVPTEKESIELRRITKFYDQNGNLLQLVSEELASSSSQSSFSESYEYI